MQEPSSELTYGKCSVNKSCYCRSSDIILIKRKVVFNIHHAFGAVTMKSEDYKREGGNKIIIIKRKDYDNKSRK